MNGFGVKYYAQPKQVSIEDTSYEQLKKPYVVVHPKTGPDRTRGLGINSAQ
jgi:hypothetical protein